MKLSNEFFIADTAVRPIVIYAITTSASQAIVKRNRWQKPGMDMRILRRKNDGGYVDVTEGEQA